MKVIQQVPNAFKPLAY